MNTLAILQSRHPDGIPWFGVHRRGWIRQAVLASLAVLLLLTAGWLWWRPATQPDLDAGRSVSEAFLEMLRANQPADAWESTTAEFKSAQGKESFVRQCKTLKFLQTSCEFVSVQTVTIGNQPRTEHLFRTATGETVRIVLGREAGLWKVDRWVAEKGS